MPEATRGFALWLMNLGGVTFPTDNRPAEVAMGRMSSLTAGPDSTAARHTDARSLAVPVSCGTLFPTTPRIETSSFRSLVPATLTAITRGRLRRTQAKVYAFATGLRTFFQPPKNVADFVPDRPKAPRIDSAA